MVLLYTIMILFLRGKGDHFHFDPLLFVAPELSTSGEGSWLGLNTYLTLREVRRWGLTPLRGGGTCLMGGSSPKPFLSNSSLV